jgi:phenylpropionate dioxygenase-like ring-hydroxylating dioxygenase large terminal subunit
MIAGWYPACRSADLGGRPRSITLMDAPIALWRDGRGAAHALVDRCPHRNAPLSMGRVHGDGSLECGYHGWRFDGGGQCVAVPGLSLGASRSRDVGSYRVVEQDGFVWIWGPSSDEVNGHRPFALPDLPNEVVFARDLDCDLSVALENSLDVPHTAFLHGGTFRGGSTAEIVAVRSALADGVEVQYHGEPVRFGPLHLAGMTFDHWDRFLLPSIAQIEYRVQGWMHLVNTIVHLPLSPTRTRAWFVVRYWSRLPARVVSPIVQLRGRTILRQDARMLDRVTDNIGRFGGEQYTSTELDLMGNAIRRLLHGDGTGAAVSPRTITFHI